MNINWVKELIEMLPDVIQNIMYGYIFLFIYRWITFKRSQNTKYTLITSIIMNYILVLIFQYISRFDKFAFLTNNTVLWYSILSFVLGLGIGWIIKSDSYNEILRDIRTGRDAVDNIWDNAIKNGTWLRIYTKDQNISYLGSVVKSEPYASNPKIILNRYSILDLDGNVLADYSKDEKEYVIMNTDDFDRIEITYSDNSICLYTRLKRRAKKVFKVARS